MLLLKRGLDANLAQSFPKALKLLVAYSSASESNGSERWYRLYTPIYSTGSER